MHQPISPPAEAIALREVTIAFQLAEGAVYTAVEGASLSVADGEIRFEILIVKVPIVSLHGVQFKKVGGDTWQYKAMAEQIVRELRL